MVADTVGGDGDDAARVDDLILAAEAIAPSFIARSPRVAGIAGVVATLNDIAASGGEPIAILDTVVGSESSDAELLAGIKAAAQLYEVPVVGGHTTVDETATAALSSLPLVGPKGRCLWPTQTLVTRSASPYAPMESW